MNDVEQLVLALIATDDVSAYQVKCRLRADGVSESDARRAISRLLYTGRMVYVAPYVLKPCKEAVKWQ